MYGTKRVVPLSKTNGNLRGKNVCIVGGTAGIGAALARASAEKGANVTVIGRTQRDFHDTAAKFVKCDLQTMAEAGRIARELPTETIDVLVFTNGIVPGNARQATSEGVEIDMAVSALSRFVMLKEMIPRLKPSARVLIWGFPGSSGYIAKTALDDFNSEKNYKGGFEAPHMNTVALNEALVLHYAAQGISTVGFNPGLIRTGIRQSLGLFTCCGGCMEGCIGCCNPSPSAYAQNVLYAFSSPDIDQHKGLMIGQSGDPILASPELTPDQVARWIAAADELATKAIGGSMTIER
jgi:NAD(P)-dependent dehydrogenase (short-subunit alcohol dehydrogenase family)